MTSAATPTTNLEEKTADTPTPSHTPSLALHDSWTLWYDNPKLAPAGSDWKDNLKPLETFQTIPDFWRVFNNILPASELTVQSNYSVFRKGIEPTWEHEENRNGGKFVLTLPKPKGKNNNNNGNPNMRGATLTKLDEYWLYTVLAVLGETMDESGSEVCGAVVSLRRSQDRIALWLKSSDPQVCIRIGERWKKALDMEKTKLRYQTHKDAAATGRSFRIDVHFEV